MKGLLFLFWAALLVGFGAVAARADLAATRYIGHGLTPVDAPGIRMASAKVDIDWGEPGKLSAVFVMNNEDDKAADVQLGFPVSLPEMFRHKQGLDFTMAFDGVPTDRASIRQATPSKDSNNVPASTIWFHCRHRFPPGTTTVKVETKLPATAAYHSPYREELFYCVETGAGWKDTIGSEEVAIHFPRPLLPGEIVRCGPASSTVEGNTVRWRFENFKPTDGIKYNVYVRFLDPDVMPILADLRRQSAEDPGNLRQKLDLIQHLYALGPVWCSFPFPPAEMPPDEYQELLGMLRSDEDRAKFNTLYVQGPDGLYRQNRDRLEDEDEITSLLSAVNYVPRDERSPFITEGHTLMAQFLQEHPHNADAWNLYLLQSIGVPGSLTIYPFQLERIRIALQNCPHDPLIRLWDTCGRLERRKQSVRSSTPTILDRRAFAKESQLQDLLVKRGVLNSSGGFTVRYSHRSDDYYFD